MNEINDWIKENYPSKLSCINKCNEAVSKIIDLFPHLTVQVGWANGIYHCWAKNKNNEIVDPTKMQFDGKIKYTLIANRFLKKHEIELSTGALFLDE